MAALAGADAIAEDEEEDAAGAPRRRACGLFDVDATAPFLALPGSARSGSCRCNDDEDEAEDEELALPFGLLSSSCVPSSISLTSSSSPKSTMEGGFAAPTRPKRLAEGVVEEDEPRISAPRALLRNSDPPLEGGGAGGPRGFIVFWAAKGAGSRLIV
jgi:hypothetical protein